MAYGRRARAPLLALGFAALAVVMALPTGQPPWRAASSVMAWAGTGLLVASLLLMIREPRLATLLGGLEPMVRWHHRSGVLGYVLLLGHVLALGLASWQPRPDLAWQALAPWLQGPAVTLGWAALLALMAGLAVTFAPRIHYRAWRRVHLALGAAVPVGLVHVLVAGDRGWLPWLAVALTTSALAWRWFVVNRGASALPYAVGGVRRPADGVVEARLRPLAGTLSVRPGQFVLARFLDSERYRACGEFHPFTVSGIGAGGELQIAVKALGQCSWRIQGIASGDLVRLQGPFGSFDPGAGDRPRLWVAGGIGVTPFVAALRAGPCRRPTALIYLFRRPQDGAFLAELQDQARSDPMFQLVAQSTGDAPADLGPLLAQVSGLAQREVHVCGPSPLFEALCAVLRARGVHTASIHHESFDFR